ncbi:multidrug efflux pump [Cohaesibacter sp. ES.047]|uniref:efflux RND transporter permease subunit n=1 Tax=Cohaesibacter sp. ES.047 TaxID=1798205 RepID=UPI000BB97C62|nr:efflux RND transporter permease subunit [Cohaesibacter sp. ES.047]SNY93049.1 multidrug efflux pump [Cohaesibacter sp. ES.047]
MNGILDTILRARRTVMTMMLVLIAAGFASYISIPKESNPDIDVPVLYISMSQNGISPEDAARLLIKPMENKLQALDGVKEMTATASEGHASVVLEFDVGFNKDQALADVRDKVDQAKAELPSDADEPTINEINFSLQPTIYVTLSGAVPERTLYQHAKRLQDELESVSTVLEANLSGSREEVLQVEIDLLKLESYNVTQTELLNAVSLNNQLVPAGFLDNGKGRFNLKIPGLIETAQDVYSIPIKQNGEGVVTLGDIAQIKRTFKDPSAITRVNGNPAISIEIKKRTGTNIIENNEAVRAVVKKEMANWNPAIKVRFMLDEAKPIFDTLGSLESSIMTAVALVMMLVLAALGFRSALLIGIAIPTSFMTGFLVLSALGMTLNMMVMFGLVLTVGMLVDGAIVIVEYADRKVAEGMERKEAYIRAAKLMFWPITSSTATTLAAFLPMLLWPGVVGEFMSYLPIMVIIVLSSALLTAMIFLPVTGGFIGRNKASAEEIANAEHLSGTHKFNAKEIKGFTGIYARFLNALASHPIGNLGTIAAVCLIGFGIVASFMQHSKGVEFFVDEEPRIAMVYVSARGNMSAVESRALVKAVEEEVLQVEGVRDVVSNSAPSGFSSGPAMGDIGGGGSKPVDAIGTLNLELDDYCCRRPSKEIFAEIRQRTADIPGIRIQVSKVEGGPPTGKDVNLQITSANYDQVANVTALVRRHFDTVPKLMEIEDTRPLPGIEWELLIDREEAGRYNASIAQVGSMVQLVTNGLLIGKYRPDDSDDELDIRVRLPEDQRSISQLDLMKLMTPNGQVPIGNFVKVAPKQEVSSISRVDGFYAMNVKATVDQSDGTTVDEKVKQIESWIDTQDWPSGVMFKFRGADEDQAESSQFLGYAAIGSLFIMAIILITQFNSFYQTALTLMTVILSIFGVLLGMLITGQKFSIVMSGTGVVALAGIVVNNAIVLIDTYNRFRADGIDIVDAVVKTAAQRIRPILLTTITTIAGLIPMATGINFDFFNRVISVGSITADWWVQLSTAVISGLAFSTLLTLILIPVLLAFPSVTLKPFFLMIWRFVSRKVSAWKTSDGEAPQDGDTFTSEESDNSRLVTLDDHKKRKKKELPDPLPPSEMPHAAE